MFEKWLDMATLARVLPAPEDFHPYPKYGERAAWDGYSSEYRAAALSRAESYLRYEWPQNYASVFMEYYTRGEREKHYFPFIARRNALHHLVIGECFEGKGRFLDDIIDGVWLICEESFWGFPAHNGVNADEEMLPNVQTPYIDLYVAETAGLLAWTRYLLKDALDAVSPMIVQRIEYELRRRVIEPYMAHKDYPWMGYINSKVNNWNPWIASNLLSVFFTLEGDADMRAREVRKILLGLDKFASGYGSDGGCEEGSYYWGWACVTLFDCCDLLYKATGGAIDASGDAVLRGMGAYEHVCHIGGRFFANFNDSRPVASNFHAGAAYRFGKFIGDARLMQLGVLMLPKDPTDEDEIRIMRTLPSIAAYGEMRAFNCDIPPARDNWIESIQLLTARERADWDGWFFAARGGHNGEFHNHNEVGNFMLYWDGVPGVVDIGVENYTRQTFSKYRYTLWTMRSDFHNLPAPNGAVQKAGREYSARDVRHAAGEERVRFSLELSGAYGADAHASSFVREYDFERSGRLVITDTALFDGSDNEIEWNFMTWRRPERVAENVVEIDLGEGRIIRLTCGDINASVTIARYESHNRWFVMPWPDGLVYRITFRTVTGERNATVFTLEKVR